LGAAASPDSVPQLAFRCQSSDTAGMTKTRIACAVVGVLSLVAAALMAWWITPSYVARIPDGKNISRTYEGTFQSLLDPTALASGNLLGAIKRNVPVSVVQDVKAEQTSGNTALMSDSRTTEAAGTKVEQTKWEYAVDRQSLEATSNHPSSWNVIPAKGLTVSFPFGAQKKNYEGWTPETQTTVPLTYLRSETKQGITTYVYEAKVPLVIACTGHALAGGALVVLTGDLRIAAQGAFKIGLNEVAIGLPVPVLAMELARDRLVTTELHRATLMATIYTPDEAVRAGYLDEVIAPAELLARAKAEAARLGALSNQAYRATKTRLRKATIEYIRNSLAADMATIMKA